MVRGWPAQASPRRRRRPRGERKFPDGKDPGPAHRCPTARVRSAGTARVRSPAAPTCPLRSVGRGGVPPWDGPGPGPAGPCCRRGWPMPGLGGGPAPARLALGRGGSALGLARPEPGTAASQSASAAGPAVGADGGGGQWFGRRRGPTPPLLCNGSGLVGSTTGATKRGRPCNRSGAPRHCFPPPPPSGRLRRGGPEPRSLPRGRRRPIRAPASHSTVYMCLY
jgi:hypothetical protein